MTSRRPRTLYFKECGLNRAPAIRSAATTSIRTAECIRDDPGTCEGLFQGPLRGLQVTFCLIGQPCHSKEL
jgi:hypothetical protein